MKFFKKIRRLAKKYMSSFTSKIKSPDEIEFLYPNSESTKIIKKRMQADYNFAKSFKKLKRKQKESIINWTIDNFLYIEGFDYMPTDKPFHETAYGKYLMEQEKNNSISRN
ncbi:MAG: hypothetical protein ISS95_01360, partial [Candidatus Aenigmarchaeota archaeon]|nr:hypothetical protein [Candidatus Aenigmarchaeota archaeon]